jgi:hypothetical protein
MGPLTPRRVASGLLALTSLVLPAVGGALMLRSAGSLAGLVLLCAGIPVAILAWVVLGRPIDRRDVLHAR